MISHQGLVHEIAKELSNDESVLALMLYGSVSRFEEGPNSDIDLLVITTEEYCQKRHIVRHGITIEYLEMHPKYLKHFIDEREIPVLFTLTEGVILLNKDSMLDPFITQAALIIQNGPPINEKWDNVGYATKRRSDLTEIYEDLLDTDDITVFHYLISLLITTAMPMLLENYSLWPKTRKKTINYLETQCYEGYRHLEILLNPQCSLSEKRNAARELIDFTLKRYGGILEGDAIIFKFS